MTAPAFLWTLARDDELVRRFNARERVKAIGRAMDVPDEALRARINRLRSEGRIARRGVQWDREAFARLLSLADAGASHAALGEAFGISRPAAVQALRRARAIAKAEGVQLSLELRAA